MSQKAEITIFSNLTKDIFYDGYERDAIEDLKENDAYDPTKETNYEEFAYDQNQFQYDIIKEELSQIDPGYILVLGTLGLWTGETFGYKVINPTDLSDILVTECDESKWFIDSHDNFKMFGHHHDGTNQYLYRQFKNSDKVNELDERLYDLINSDLAPDVKHKKIKNFVKNHTSSLGKVIKNELF